MSFGKVSSPQSEMSRRRVRWVILQNRNRIQVADIRALIMFTIFATCVGSLANCEKRLAVSMKNGAPGGWPISIL